MTDGADQRECGAGPQSISLLVDAGVSRHEPTIFLNALISLLHHKSLILSHREKIAALEYALAMERLKDD